MRVYREAATKVYYSIRKSIKLLGCFVLAAAYLWFYEYPSMIEQSLTKEKYNNTRILHFMTNTLREPSQNICTNNTYLIILVESHIHNSGKRNEIRRFSSLQISNPEERMIRIFMLGNSRRESPRFDQRIQREHKKYGDILQGAFKDHYRNLTYKTLMGLKWVTKACASATYIVKMKETWVLDIQETLNFLRQLDVVDKKNLIIGDIIIGKIPERLLKQSKDYVSWIEFSDKCFPSYVLGEYYITTPQVAARITREAPYHSYLSLEDVFVTGILTQALNISITDFKEVNYMPIYDLP